MKQSVSKYDFERAFADCGRKDQFSYDALNALYDWFEQYDDDCGTETELDVIAICCDFSEDGWDDIAQNYNIDLTDCDDDDDYKAQAVEDYLSENTLLVARLTGDVFVYQSF